ncbi:hypothetical protein L9F63_020916, partial [Diploptera punctata]
VLHDNIQMEMRQKKVSHYRAQEILGNRNLVFTPRAKLTKKVIAKGSKFVKYVFLGYLRALYSFVSHYGFSLYLLSL